MSKGSVISEQMVVVDSAKINEMFNDLELSNDSRKKALRDALRKSILIIRKQAQLNLTNSIPAAGVKGYKYENGSLKTYKPLKNEIHIAVYRNASGARIDMMDLRKKDSRAYILRFLEFGTTDRMTGTKNGKATFKTNKKGELRKPANRGRIKASNFFNNAVNSKKMEALTSLEQNIIDMIKKAANQK